MGGPECTVPPNPVIGGRYPPGHQASPPMYITEIIHISCYNGRLPVEALAHRSWPPITKNIINTY